MIPEGGGGGADIPLAPKGPGGGIIPGFAATPVPAGGGGGSFPVPVHKNINQRSAFSSSNDSAMRSDGKKDMHCEDIIFDKNDAYRSENLDLPIAFAGGGGAVPFTPFAGGAALGGGAVPFGGGGAVPTAFGGAAIVAFPAALGAGGGGGAVPIAFRGVGAVPVAFGAFAGAVPGALVGFAGAVAFKAGGAMVGFATFVALLLLAFAVPLPAGAGGAASGAVLLSPTAAPVNVVLVVTVVFEITTAVPFIMPGILVALAPCETVNVDVTVTGGFETTEVTTWPASCCVTVIVCPGWMS